MELTEYTSKNLGVHYVLLKDSQLFLCENGVLFTKKEYLDGIDLKMEYIKRSMQGELYDYEYAKATGNLRKLNEKPEKLPRSVLLMCLALMVTSFGSMYISTVHTATYLLDYVDKVSAWLMSGVITVYCATAFEVVLLFHDRKKHVLSVIFGLLWALVVLFSMVTTVSVFYDRYNFAQVQQKTESAVSDSAHLSLSVLQTQEKDLREAISFKKKDIEYRQERDYATTAVRVELDKLQKQLQENLEKQKELVEKTPDAVKTEESTIRKENLFAFLGRKMNIDGGVLEFIMSTLSAVFINIISPLSVSVVISFFGGMKNEHSKRYLSAYIKSEEE